MSNLIFGCGMPKSGLKELSKILSKCKKVNVKYQYKDILPHKYNPGKLRIKIESLRKLRGELVGDVGHYYLSYVEDLIRIYNSRVVCLKEDRKEIIKLMKELDHNPYHQKVDEESKGFPYYAKELDTATGYYWDGYYKLIERLRSRIPHRLLILESKELKTEEGIKKLFDFCKIPEECRK